MPDQADQLRQLVRRAVRRLPEIGPLPPVVAVTGAVSGAGATTLACEAARELTALGQRVLLIDANVTNPCVVDFFGLHNNSSIRDVLSGERRLIEASASLDRGLSVLGGRDGLVPPPLDLAAQHRLLEELAASAHAFDFVLVDGGVAGTPWSDRLWQLSQQILLAATPSAGDLRAAYATLKLAHQESGDARLSDGRLRLVLGVGGAVERASHAADQFAHTCRRFLGLKIGHAFLLPAERELSPAEDGLRQQAMRNLAAEILSYYHVTTTRVRTSRAQSRP
ncbi:hypothetical protein OAS39_09395 [Pirellulales bacterium]|nr:hypothetical protein [Pirellulales bacterium]